MRPELWIIAGPTASGKTAVGKNDAASSSKDKCGLGKKRAAPFGERLVGFKGKLYATFDTGG